MRISVKQLKQLINEEVKRITEQGTEPRGYSEASNLSDALRSLRTAVDRVRPAINARIERGTSRARREDGSLRAHYNGSAQYIEDEYNQVMYGPTGRYAAGRGARPIFQALDGAREFLAQAPGLVSQITGALRRGESPTDATINSLITLIDRVAASTSERAASGDAATAAARAMGSPP